MGRGPGPCWLPMSDFVQASGGTRGKRGPYACCCLTWNSGRHVCCVLPFTELFALRAAREATGLRACIECNTLFSVPYILTA